MYDFYMVLEKEMEGFGTFLVLWLVVIFVCLLVSV